MKVRRVTKSPHDVHIYAPVVGDSVLYTSDSGAICFGVVAGFAENGTPRLFVAFYEGLDYKNRTIRFDPPEGVGEYEYPVAGCSTEMPGTDAARGTWTFAHYWRVTSDK